MTRSDLIAQILINNRLFSTADEAKLEILKTFKEEYPYWSYADWDQTIPQHIVMATLNRTKTITNPSVKHLIKDLDTILNGE